VSRARHLIGSLALAATLLAAAPVQAATQWSADPARSKLGFTGLLTGGTFQGSFNRFQPEISFDPADLAGSRFRVTVETASADTRDGDRDAILKGPDFFAVERWPKATFEATKFAAAGPGRYTAQGKLTLRDVTRDVTLAFSFKPAADGRTATLAGATSVNRLDFGVGQGDWRDTQMVGNEVKISFDLLLRRK
jgi:polyisoprenoid-binding protein YceI